MWLLCCLIEYLVIFNEKVLLLGNNIKCVVKGLVIGLVMVVVIIIVIFVCDYWGEIIVLFIIVMFFIYVFWEIFKDDLCDMLWCWISKGKVKW